MKKLQAVLIAGVAAGALMAGSAQADIIIDSTTPTDFSIVFEGTVGGEGGPIEVEGLTGTANFTYTGLVDYDLGGDPAETENAYSFDVVLTNTSDADIWTSARISALAFDAVANPVGGEVSGDFTKFILQGSLPNQFGDIDVCVNDAPGAGQSCQGSASGGPNIGDDPFNFTIILAYNAPPPASITLSNFGVRLQSLTSNPDNTLEYNYTGASGTGSGTPTNGTPVPEPATLALLGIGLLGAGYMARRRRLDA